LASVLDTFRLDGRIAVVTGGSGNIGSSICGALAEAGATVVIAARNLAKSEVLAARIEAGGGRAIALPLDLADEASITTFHDDVIAQVGTAEILVNNAISMFPGHVERYSTKDWERAMQVDGTGFFRITQLFLNDMLAAGRGNIITIASILGMVGPEERLYPTRGIAGFRPNYFFVKAGVVGYSRFLATAYATHNIRVNCISPGGVEANPPRKDAAGFIDRVPMKRLASPDDMKGAVVFLASDASAYVTGQNLVVDGGYTAW
jgi:NAD(P)-dependent dehydrogenase (short-subunit alcohol dehydrogenase family)